MLPALKEVIDLSRYIDFWEISVSCIVLGAEHKAVDKDQKAAFLIEHYQ